MPICQSENNQCLSKFGCPPNRCPDFEIKRHDTRPPLTITVSDCDGPLDLTDCIAEVSMWANARLKKNVAVDDEYFSLSNDIGFEQSLVGDIIVVNRVRAPEQMLVTGHDEVNKLIRVQRAYNGTSAGSYKRGTKIKIFRVLNSTAETNMVYEDVEQIDGTITNELIESQLIYNWLPNDTCLPGCYWIEFKLLKMSSSMWVAAASTVVPTFTSISYSEAGCEMGAGVEWVRRFPVNDDGFLVKVFDTPTSENIS
jgi:hypothetical protein